MRRIFLIFSRSSEQRAKAIQLILLALLLILAVGGGDLQGQPPIANTVTGDVKDRVAELPLLKPRGTLNLNFPDIDIRKLLSGLAIDQGVSIVMAQDVAGKVSVHLNHVTIDEAVRAIVLAGGVSFQKTGDVYYVFKPKDARDAQSERLQLRIFKLKFAPIDKVQDILSAIPGMRTVKAHEPSRTIIVEDTPENIAKIETLIDHWDTLPQQVLIEAQILEITLNDDMSMGVDWQKLMGDLTFGIRGFTGATTGLYANLVTATGTRHQFTAALEALQTKTNVKALSAPKILALHGKPARVQVGGKQGYKVTTSNMGVTTETIQFIDTGTILDITPYIDDSGNVLLVVQPSINSAIIDNKTGIPVVTSTIVSTSLLAKSGETIFIGGLLKDTRSDTRQMIPLLGEIPILGYLFGHRDRGTGKSELVVLITPYIQQSEIRRTTEEATGKLKELDRK
jgi:type II secretory pathway component GspD/PulD (secretin)